MANLSVLPQTETILQNPLISNWFPKISRALVLTATRDVLEQVRSELLKKDKDNPSFQISAEKLHSIIIKQIEKKCRNYYCHRIQRVINATGIILHTNMGRAPIAKDHWEAVKEVNCGYSNLELDLSNGKRGRRNGLIPQLLAHTTGAESALVVNNNASALFLILSALAQKREVIISRGEQIQIGGGFRIPDIMQQSGAVIKEVGTTNVTTTQDYLAAVTPDTAMILLVHRSNFTIRGFKTSPNLQELANKIPQHIPIVFDQGSGVIKEQIPGEQRVEQLLRQGADLVCFSGDKVLGCIQAGCITGKSTLIDILAKHPMYRILRPGKTVFSLLEEQLIHLINGSNPIPIQMLRIPKETVKKRLRRITKGLKSDKLSIVDSFISTGGGSAPDEYVVSSALSISHIETPQIIIDDLRNSQIPIIGTISNNNVMLHGATIDDQDIPYVRQRVIEILDTLKEPQ